MKVVAFLQNQWFRDPERMKQIRQSEHWRCRPRHEWNATWLFFGCLTGKRLRIAFTEEWCEEIIWEEVSEELGGRSSSAFPADSQHIRHVLDEHQPTHVLAFGRIASDALTAIYRESQPSWRLITGPHPAARGSDVTQRLRSMFETLMEQEP